MNYQTLNPLFGAIAAAQGIPIGSDAWRKGGIEAFSGQTGGHAAYGWRRPEKMTLDRVRAVLANYCSRPCFYWFKGNDGELIERESGYRIAGRPDGWTPEDSMDLANGERAYLTPNGLVKVSGPDPQHFWIDPLLHIIDEREKTALMMVDTAPGRKESALVVATVVAQQLMDSYMGMVLHHGEYWGPGRSWARTVDAFTQAFKRGILRKEAIAAFADWLVNRGLPVLEKAPGVTDAKHVGKCNIYQEIGWTLPPLYDCERVFEETGTRPEDKIPERLRAIRTRLSQWMVDIEEVAPGQVGREQLRITSKMKEGINGKPLPTLKGAIKAEDYTGEKWYRDWNLTAAHICALTLPDNPTAQKIKQYVTDDARKGGVFKNSHHNKPFAVDENREWLT